MCLSTRLRAVLIILCLVSFSLGLIGPHMAQAQTPHVLVMDVDGVINPVAERFISRALEQAEVDGAALLVIRLDTPGGLLESTRNIVEDLLAAPVPVAVYVSPPGARAGSAGTFITAAAHFAAMAPGTNIGAATPVSSTGEEIPETLASKVENDAAALIRSIAQERGRNEKMLEQTVLTAASYSAKEAVDLNVVDLIADDLEELLEMLEGRRAETLSGTRTMRLEGLAIREFSKNPLERFLEFISNPNVSFILLTVGGLGVIIELFSPGLVGPGVVGAVCLLLAFLALGNLPVNWVGVALVLLAIALVFLEVQVSGIGVLGIAAVISFVIGGFLLFTQFGDVSPTLPDISVNYWLLGGMAVTFAFAVLYVGRLIAQSRHDTPQRTTNPLLGEVGVVVSPLQPRGLVRLGEENWTAVSEDGSVVNKDEPVIVIDVHGVVLTVIRLDATEI
jgi:membrane-bound serine protease (ClpP class)